MSIKLSREDKMQILPSIQKYIEEEFDLEIGDLKAELLLSYFIKEIGPYAYNQGVKDAETFIRAKLEDLQGSCYEFELTYWNDNKKS